MPSWMTPSGQAGGASDNIIQWSRRPEAGKLFEFVGDRLATLHVLEAIVVGLVVWHEFDLGS